jgi:CSLREA domain-containing protein
MEVIRLISRLTVAVALTFLCVAATGSAVAGSTSFTPTRFDDPIPDGCVPTDCSLREAIIAANAASGETLISLQPGTYTLMIPFVEGSGAQDGDLDINADDLTLTGSTTGVTTIDGGNAIVPASLPAGPTPTRDRIFEIDPGAQVSISQLVLQNGDNAGPGGAIEVHGDVELTNSTITQNRGQGGGAIAVQEGGTLYMELDTISNNTATQFGGAIYNNGTFESNNIQIVENKVVNVTCAGCGTGGGVYNVGDLKLTNTTVRANEADGGGGMNNLAAATISSSTFSDNTYNAIINSRDATTMHLDTSTISGNHGGNGVTQTAAGGIANYSVLNINNTTITLNSATLAGAGGILSDIDGTVNLRQSIIAGNDTDCVGDVVSQGDNLDGDDTCLLTGPGDQPSVDPKLGPLQDNGGKTFTHSPQPNSPAVDAVTAACPPPATDQRDIERPQGDACDIGSVEMTSGVAAIFGDWNCNGAIDPEDASPVLWALAGLQYDTPADCLDQGAAVFINGQDRQWGDSNCDQSNTIMDPLLNFLGAAGIPREPPAGCPRVGDGVTLLR